MKSLKQFILEEFETVNIKDLTISYICNTNGTMIFNVPDVFSEDDFTLYIQDKYFNDLPASENKAKEFFGKNALKIYDVIFEYDSYEKSDDLKSDDAVEWDTNINKSHNDDEKFTYVKVSGLKYVVKFDDFDIEEKNSNDTNYNLKLIFNRCNSSYTNNQWPIKLTFDEKNIKYTES